MTSISFTYIDEGFSINLRQLNITTKKGNFTIEDDWYPVIGFLLWDSLIAPVIKVNGLFIVASANYRAPLFKTREGPYIVASSPEKLVIAISKSRCITSQSSGNNYNFSLMGMEAVSEGPDSYPYRNPAGEGVGLPHPRRDIQDRAPSIRLEINGI